MRPKRAKSRTTIELEVDEIGPSLRYATASVTRAASSGARGEDAWAPSAPAPAADVWATPGNYADETPF